MLDLRANEIDRLTSENADYIERVRRLNDRLDRWRTAHIATWVILLVGFIAFLSLLPNAFVAGGMWAGMGPGFIFGLFVGTLIGTATFKLAHGLIGAIDRGRRTDRLLVQYHDALRQIVGDPQS